MSIANLLHPNDYAIQAKSLTVDTLSVSDLVVNEIDATLVDADELDTRLIKLANGVNIVELSTGSDGHFRVGPSSNKIIDAGGIKFSGTGSTLTSYVADDGTDYVFNLAGGPEVGQIICRFSRIGSAVFCQIRGFIEGSASTLVSTATVPASFRPGLHAAFFDIPVQTDAVMPTVAGGTVNCSIGTDGIVSVYSAVDVALDGGSTYYICRSTGSGTDRYNFSYLI